MAFENPVPHQSEEKRPIPSRARSEESLEKGALVYESVWERHRQARERVRRVDAQLRT